MRMILVMIVLVVIALLVAKQLQGPVAAPQSAVSDEQGVPHVPTRPQGVPAFEEDINAFTLESAEARARQLEEMEK